MRRAVAVGGASLPLWFLVYLGLVYPPTEVEYLVAPVAALITATITAVTVRVMPGRWSWPPGAARTLVSQPWQLVRGYLRVAAAGLAPHRGPVRGALRQERQKGIGRVDAAGGASRRAWTAWARSLAADELVAGFPDEDTVAVHVLPGRPRAAGRS